MSEILLIEDSEIDAAQAESALKIVGIKNPVHRLSDGAAAMRLLADIAEDPNGAPPGVIFLDVKLPLVTGFEILRWMRDQKIFKRTLKIIFSTLDDTDTIKEAYHLGANSFLNKPVRPDDLRELIITYPRYWGINGSSQVASMT